MSDSKEEKGSESESKIAFHSINILDQNLDPALEWFLRTGREIRLQIPDEFDSDPGYEPFYPHIVSIRFTTTALRLATVRDPVTRKRAGYIPTGKNRKCCWPIPMNGEGNESRSCKILVGRKPDPVEIRMVALLAKPGTIEIQGGIPTVRKYLIARVAKEMWRFKSKRLREPFQRLIQALRTPYPPHIAAILDKLSL